MRITVVGNCQIVGISEALKVLLPSAEITGLWIGRTQDLDRVKEAIAGADRVFAHETPSYGDMSSAALRDAVPDLQILPKINFTGFHPDIAFIRHEGKFVPSVTGIGHSCITAAAYSLRMPVDRVPSLFNAFIYRKLGYYNEFAKARVSLAKHMAERGFDLATMWQAWMDGGGFMHTIVHPNICVLSHVATRAAERAGLIAPGATPPVVPYDWLADYEVWPVYEELADHLEIPGSDVFKVIPSAASKGSPRCMGLAEVISRSYVWYETCPPETFQSAPIKRVADILVKAVR